MPFAEAEIRRGLDADEFFPVFQPLVELRSGQLAGFEVLARWNHPQAGVILPKEFIPAVERVGLINELTAALLRKSFVCAPLLERPVMLSFNLAATQLLNPRLPERLAALAEAGGFPLNRLTVEITETALVDDLPRAAAVAHQLKALHCRLALDDFGTGYSSLTHLHALPFDELKIDRTFVSSLTQNHQTREIVASVVGLGLGLGLLTVAEGVETEEQAAMLFGMGCNLVQGWLYGKPLPAADLPAVLARSPWQSPSAARSLSDGTTLASLQALPAHRLAQLQAIYDGAPVGLCFLDRNLRYVSLNRQLAEMNGVPAAAHLGRTVAEVIPHVFPLVQPFLLRALAGEPVTGVEATRPANGPGQPEQTVMLSYRSVRDGGGDVVGVSVAVMDVTRHKRAEEALRESEEHYRHWINLSPHVPWVLDAHGAVIEASPRWEQFTGQKLSDALGDGWMQMLHPDDLAHTQEAIRESLATGMPIDIEYRVRRPGGEWKSMRSRGSPRFSPSGAIIGVYGVVEEIDGRLQATEELETCEAQLRAAVNAVPVGVVVADGLDGTIRLVNPQARAALCGGAFPGQRLAEYDRMGVLSIDGQPLAPDQHPLARAIRYGDVIESQPFLVRLPDQSLLQVALSSRAIRSDEGQIIGGVMTIHGLNAA